MGDFNSDPCNKILQEFCNLYDMKNLVTEPTCYKTYNQPTCIDLMFTNRIKHCSKYYCTRNWDFRFPQDDNCIKQLL